MPDEIRTPAAGNHPHDGEHIEIVYRSRDVVVAIKPAGLLSEDAGEGSLPRILAAQLKPGAAVNKGSTGKNAIYVVHRLDRGVGGLIAYALTPDAAASLSGQITDGRFKKEYLTVVHGCPEASEGELRDLLYFDRARNKSFVVDRQRKGVREAVLTYRLLGSVKIAGQGKDCPEETISLLGITLQTGRTHQIRVQLASRKMPIYGDSRYGSRVRGEDIALHSARLCFSEPLGGQPVELKAAPPARYPWNLFGNYNDNEYFKYFT